MGFELSSIAMREQRAWETGSAEPEAHQKRRISDCGNLWYPRRPDTDMDNIPESLPRLKKRFTRPLGEADTILKKQGG